MDAPPGAHDASDDSHDDDEEEESEEEEPPKRSAPPKRKQTEEDAQADDLSAALRQKRDEDRSKGKAVSRQLVSPLASLTSISSDHRCRRFGTLCWMREFDCRNPYRRPTAYRRYDLFSTLTACCNERLMEGRFYRHRRCRRSYPIQHASPLNTRHWTQHLLSATRPRPYARYVLSPSSLVPTKIFQSFIDPPLCLLSIFPSKDIATLSQHLDGHLPPVHTPIAH